MRVKHALLAAAALGCVFPAVALGGTLDELVEKRDKKLKSEFFKAAPWLTDFTQAREESKKTAKPIFAYFTRSYAP